jgi:diguanylate cyclase (GGDEF)-like protein
MEHRRNRLRVAQDEPQGAEGTDAGETRRGVLAATRAVGGPRLRVAGEAGAAEPARTAELAVRRLAGLSGAVAAVYLRRGDGLLGLESIAAPTPVPGLNAAPLLATRAAAAGRVVSATSGELAELDGLGCACREAFAAPLDSAGETVGVLLAFTPGEGDGELPLRSELVATFAELASASLANARKLALTFVEARRDPLTGLGNHRAFHEHLDAILRSAFALGVPVTLVLLDVDDFKDVNDVEGHAVGDRVLREIARLASGVRRSGEEIFRIGGDEIAIAIEGDADAGLLVGERIRGALARAARDGRSLPTVSVGVAAFPEDARAKGELLHKADVALYAAKRSGKDRSLSYADGVRGGAGRSASEALWDALRDRVTDETFVAAELSELSAVAAVVRTIRRARSPRALLDAAARGTASVVDAAACRILRLENADLREAAIFSPTPWEVRKTLGPLLPQVERALELDEPALASVEDADAESVELLLDLEMTSAIALPLRVAGERWGVVEIFDGGDRRFGARETALAELVLGHLEALLASFEHAEAVERVYRESIGSLSLALEERESYASEHAEEVRLLALDTGRELGLPDESLRALELAALLHDVGKIRIPESIINKPGPLTELEWELVRQHPEAAARILEPIGALEDVVPVIRASQEWWDGSGYPDGLAGEEIPLEARLLAVCAAYRAMVEPRAYRDPLGEERALRELAEAAGTQFDPTCVRALRAALEERRRARRVLRRPA